MDVTRPSLLTGGVSHRLAPLLGWGTATFVTVGPFVSLVADGYGYDGGFAPLIPLALPVIFAMALLLRRFPLTTVVLLLASAVATTLMSYPLGHTSWVSPLKMTFAQVGPAILAVCYIAATRPRRTALSALSLVLVTLVGYEAFKFAQGMIPGLAQDQLPVAGDAVFAWLIGHSIHQRRRFVAASRAQVTEQAITAERLRIARELHDMVAHSVGIIAIQAGVGSRVIETQPAEARKSLQAIEATSRETLSGLRRTLVALRQTDPVAASEKTPLTPAGLADLDRLAATSENAGVRVDVRWCGQRRPLPPDIDLAAYRIVQEAVTNVTRHAGTAHCRVTIEYDKEELSVEIVDDGRGMPTSAGGKGFGITGMRERISLLHGEFNAGPRPEGGFRVAARLPLPEPVAAMAEAR